MNNEVAAYLVEAMAVQVRIEGYKVDNHDGVVYHKGYFDEAESELLGIAQRMRDAASKVSQS